MTRTPEKARTPEMTRTPELAKIPNCGKAPLAQASPALTLDCMIVDWWVPPPSQAMSARECRATSASYGQNRERTAESDHSPRQGACKKKKVVVAERPGSSDGLSE